MVRFYSGYIQVQETEFNDLRSVNNTFTPDLDLKNIIDEQPTVTQSAERIESFALVGSESKSYPALLFGIQPETEDSISGLSKWIGEGEFLKSGSRDIVIGKVLAENLEVAIGDSLVMISQGYHGVSATGLYRISGLLDFPLPDLSKQVIYMDIENCQEFFDLPAAITSYVIMVNTPEEVAGTIAQIKPELAEHLKIYSWDELQPELVNLIEGKVASGKVIKGLLFMVIGFGVWATIIMLMHERKRELGVMIAIGFQKTKITVLLIIESFLIGVIGVILGIGGSLPIIWYLYKNPIYVTGEIGDTYRSMGFEPVIKFSSDADIFFQPAIIVFLIFALISLYQIYYVFKLKAVTALKA